MVKERENYIDICKGICMLCVICIHCELFNVLGFTWTNFAVPMFFFMSGFFDRTDMSFKECLKKNVQRLIVTSIIWIIIGRTFFKLLTVLNGDNPQWLSFDIYDPAAGLSTAWFLISLFVVKIMIWLTLQSNLHRLILLLLFIVVGYYGMNTQMPMYFDEALVALPFYYCGKLTYNNLKTFIENKFMVVIGFIFYVMLVYRIFFFWLNPSVNGTYSPTFLIAMISTLVSFIPFLWISRFIERTNILGGAAIFLSKFGKHTLGVLLFHVPLCHISAVILHRIYDRGTIGWIILFFVAYIFIIMISYYSVLFLEKYFPFLYGRGQLLESIFAKERLLK